MPIRDFLRLTDSETLGGQGGAAISILSLQKIPMLTEVW